MNEVFEFLKKELNICIEEKTQEDKKLHRSHLDLEAVSNTKRTIISRLDNTFDIFSASGNSNSFLNDELESLSNRESDIRNNIKTIEKKVAYLDSRINELQLLINDINDKDKNLQEESYCNSKYSGREIISIQEKERQRIARDIHDSVVQKMTALIHKSEFSIKMVDTDAQRAKLEMEVINNIVRDCIADLRKIIFDLRPMSLDDLGFEITLKSHIKQIENASPMEIDFELINNSDVENIDFSVTITILRIIQELSSNSIKYSYGTNIQIAVKVEPNMITLIHSDNGVGFDIDNISFNEINKTGFGIQFLKERVSLLGGTFKTLTNCEEHKKGTKYIINIPYTNKSEEEV